MGFVGWSSLGWVLCLNDLLQCVLFCSPSEVFAKCVVSFLPFSLMASIFSLSVPLFLQGFPAHSQGTGKGYLGTCHAWGVLGAVEGTLFRSPQFRRRFFFAHIL